MLVEGWVGLNWAGRHNAGWYGPVKKVNRQNVPLLDCPASWRFWDVLSIVQLSCFLVLYRTSSWSKLIGMMVNEVGWMFGSEHQLTEAVDDQAEQFPKLNFFLWMLMDLKVVLTYNSKSSCRGQLGFVSIVQDFACWRIWLDNKMSRRKLSLSDQSKYSTRWTTSSHQSSSLVRHEHHKSMRVVCSTE